MPLDLKSYNDGDLVHGYEMVVNDEERLAEITANLLAGQYRHVSKILNSIPGNPPLTSDASIDALIERLTLSASDSENKRHKRDGWVFQMISWVAVHKTTNQANSFLLAPHDAPGHHGLDGLAVSLNSGRNEIEQVLITEDKATESPRNKIQQKVFKEFRELESGVHDNRLITQLSSLLDGRISDEEFETIQDKLYRKEKRTYRIGVTVAAGKSNQSDRAVLFKDFDTTVSGGDSTRRRGDTLELGELRSWMDGFSQKVINSLNNLKTAANV